MKREISIEEDVDFKVQKFDYNKYELDDGTILRIAVIPIKIFRTSDYDNRGSPIYHVLSQTIVSAIVPQELRSEPSNNKLPPDLEKLESEDIEFRPIEEPRNEYILSDGTTIKFRCVVSNVIKYEYINQFGEPSYSINSTNTMAAISPKSIRKKRK